jgi:hypothetical protein
MKRAGVERRARGEDWAAGASAPRVASETPHGAELLDFNDRSGLSEDRHRPVIVAVVAVPVVQPPVDQEIDVVAVGHFFVAAVVVRATADHRGAGVGIVRVHRNDVLVIVAVVGGVQVAVVQVIHVPVVLDAGVAAVVAVDVAVLVVNVVTHALYLLLESDLILLSAARRRRVQG